MHFAVMAPQAMEYLAVRPDGTYLDATAGLGGHTAEIARRLTTGKVIANDRDPESLEMARRNTAAWADRICFHHGPFSRLAGALPACGAQQVDGLLADLGVSRYQLTEPERGFSFLSAGPLDMRMDRSKGVTAADVLNQYAEEAIADLLYQLGEERRARKIARAIVRARPLRSSLDLAGLVEQAVPRTNRIHPATRTFMALRMFVNDEQGELDRLLEIGPELLAGGGRMVAISFTSLEDRKVKQRFRALEQEGRATILTRHPLTPTEEETRLNPPSRSAKLRALEMKG
ncbi:MAG: 16S rRNA (cytosine(1402)-N(4))-methyltransferase RsmH [Bryobacteraceae bacterium]